MRDQVVPRVIAQMLIPYIFLFGFYVITLGEIGPGGGFQGGVILAAAVILHSLVYGIEATQRALPRVWIDRLMAFGVLLYAGVGLYGLISGNAFLDYRVLGKEPHGAEALGMTLVDFPPIGQEGAEGLAVGRRRQQVMARFANGFSA